MRPNVPPLTPEQVIEIRQAAELGLVPRLLVDTCDIAVGHRFCPEERRLAQAQLAQVYAVGWGPLADLLEELAHWAQARRFDDDQDPGDDTPDERLVRAFFRFEAVQ